MGPGAWPLGSPSPAALLSQAPSCPTPSVPVRHGPCCLVGARGIGHGLGVQGPAWQEAGVEGWSCWAAVSRLLCVCSVRHVWL